jgi:hypothetical protein
MRQLAAIISLFALLGVGYLWWLNAGCELTGVMTWEGKQCVSDL